ncbi:VOC family protein [Nonomuraea rhodomycinica]|uniref:VOC family protein n=1 Tax=Nonomuraea rhodomycinica TaxID=1712872 RepID=A0A7Y6MC76_9ACTN|nr:VOC family protein [Nonomuraea rhodomycinica]NUW43068.1 VOC family protein [Nonomuraea rhodomycinica]
MRVRLNQIVVDCRDPRSLVRFWAALLGGDPVDRARGWSHVEPPEGVRLAFQPVAEDKAVKNRLHLDIEVDAIEPATAHALRLGATRIGETVTDDKGSFQVMADPEGNEFCFVCDHATTADPSLPRPPGLR